VRPGVVGLIVVLAFLCAYPLAMLFYGSLHSSPPGEPGVLDLAGYEALFSAENLVVIANTVLIALIKTSLSLAFAVLLAWILVRTDTPFRSVLETLITLPFFIPPILTALAWGMLANPEAGSINLAWRWLTGGERPLVNVYSYGGVIWHMMQYSTAFIFLFVVEALRKMDSSLEEAGRTCGAGITTTAVRITMALMLPTLTSAFILSFIRGLENFESPVFFGTPAGIEVMTTRMYDLITQQAQPQYQTASALGFAAMAFMLVLVIVQQRMLGRRSFVTVGGKRAAQKLTRLGGFKWLTLGICLIYITVSVVLPIGQLVIGSLSRFFGVYEGDAFTFEHYRSIFADPEIRRAAINTVTLGVIGSSATLLLGSLVAYVTTRTLWAGRGILIALSWMPWMMPGIVLGLGFLWSFALLPPSIPIYGTPLALLIAYVALGTPVSVRLMSGVFSQLSADIEECARTHGASWLQAFLRVIVALVWPSVAVGWILVFFGILRELSASILLYAPGSEVLSVTMFKLWSSGQAEQVSAIGVCTLVLVLVFRLVQGGIGRRRNLSRIGSEELQ
jgi:iron(III) transport system permease protein